MLDNIPLLIYRISLGKFTFYHDSQKYILFSPSLDLKYKSELLYDSIIQDNKYENWIRKENLNFILKKLEIWDLTKDDGLKQIEKQIENFKANLYLNRLNKDKMKTIRKDIADYKDQLNKLYNQKHSMDYLTLEDHASLKKSEFIILHTLFYDDEKTKVLADDASKVDFDFFNSILSTISSHFINIETYKKIARNEIWKSMYHANKSNIFNKAACDLTDEQRTLISISIMYDRIYENPECPEDSVIEDDDMLDGWMLIQRKKSEDLKKQNSATDVVNKHANAKEIFITGNKEDVDNILSLNSVESQNIIKQRAKIITTKKEGIDEYDLPDVQLDILQKKNVTRK